MTADTYSVWTGGALIADSMSLEDALVLVEALFHKYWSDPSAAYTIRKNQSRLGGTCEVD